MSALLSVSDAHVAYGKVEAVRGVSLEVLDDEIVTIIGANGAGKTTLLNAIMGILPLRGAAAFADQDITPLEIEADIDKVFATFPRLKERAAQLAGTMSGGEQQMLAMGRALMARPKVLLLDEPSMGLSPIMVDKIFEVIESIHKQGTTVLLVEQNASRALSIANRGYVMESGEVTMSGQADMLLNDPKVRAAYLGE